MENNITGAASKKPVFRAISSVFHFVLFAVKVLLLSSLSVIYFIIGGLAAVLFLVFYEKLFKTLLMSLGRRRPGSPYYYRWKNNHLELNY